MPANEVERVVKAYEEHFGAPSSTPRLKTSFPGLSDIAVVVYLPTDPEVNTTQLGTAGLSLASIAKGSKAELGFEVSGTLSKASILEVGKALVDLGLAPLTTGKLFETNQVLTNVSLPLFPRFTLALLIDWDPVYGFTFPGLEPPVSLLRVVPVFESEAKFFELSKDKRDAYAKLFNWGLKPEDPKREAVK
jgi:hypothetical protein